MNKTYDVHLWSKQYREEALYEAKTRHLEGQLRAPRNPTVRVALLVATLLLVAILLVGSGCTSSDIDSVDVDTANSSTSASASPSALDSASSSTSSSASASADSDSVTASTSESASGSASASSSASSSSSADADAARFAGMRSSTSIECYTFYSDGTVELRHGGTSTVSDSGSYQGDEDFGEIVWDSGRWTSTVVADGDGLIIDDLKVSPVASCF